MNEDHSVNDEALLRLRHGGEDQRQRLAALAKSDPAIDQRLKEWDRQDAALFSLYNPLADDPIPSGHTEIIAAAAKVTTRSLSSIYKIAAVVALSVLCSSAGWIVAKHQVPNAAETDLVTSALRAYSTYSVEVVHPVEVAASDSAHLQSWLSNRVGRQFTPPDLASDGFRLLGGRVVPDSNGTAAFMMYEDALGRRVTLYIAPAPGSSETALRFAPSDTAQGFWWVDDQLGCALFGDLPSETLRAISLSAYRQISDA